MNKALRENAPRGTKSYPFKKLVFEVERERMNIIYHWHPELEILLVRRGGFTVSVGGNDFEAEDGDIFFVSPDTLHSVSGGEGIKKDYDALLFFPSLFSFAEKNDLQEKIIAPLVAHRIAFPERISKNDEAYGEICPLVERVSSLNNAPPSDSARMETALTLLTLIFTIYDKGLFKIPLSESYETERLRSVIAFIEKNFGRRLTLRELAEVCGFSEGYFCSFFKKGTDKTPMEYLNEVRISRAIEKLESTDESVTSISLECGFESLAYFIRRFSAHTGISPREWRKRRCKKLC